MRPLSVYTKNLIAINPANMYKKITRKLNRMLHDAWGDWCSRVGPPLKIIETAPAVTEIIPLRRPSVTERTGTLDQLYYEQQGVTILKHPPATLYNIKNVFIVGSESFMFTDAHTLLRLDSSMDDAPLRKVRRPIACIAGEIEEAVLSLGSRYTDNHAHFLFEHLPLVLLAREHLGSDFPLKILISADQSWWQTEYLVMLGEPAENIIEISRGTLRCANLWMLPNLPMSSRANPYDANIYREIARRFKSQTRPRKKDRYLFLTRKDAPRRRLINEDDILDSLRKLYPDIECIALSQISLSEQIALFAEAKFVAGPTSQAFRHLLFCEGALSLELAPGHRNSDNKFYEWSLSVHNTGMIHGNRCLTIYANQAGKHDEADWVFPIERFNQALQRLVLMGEIPTAIATN